MISVIKELTSLFFVSTSLLLCLSLIFFKAECRIESSDKANRKCLRQRQRETAQNRLFYELGPPTVNFPLPSLNKNQTVVYGMLKQDPLDSRWIDLYIKGTIRKNLDILKLFFAATDGTEFETEGDYVKAYKFFLSRQKLPISNPVGALSVLKFKALEKKQSSSEKVLNEVLKSNR